jgi:hypothetical protein
MNFKNTLLWLGYALAALIAIFILLNILFTTFIFVMSISQILSGGSPFDAPGPTYYHWNMLLNYHDLRTIIFTLLSPIFIFGGLIGLLHYVVGWKIAAIAVIAFSLLLSIPILNFITNYYLMAEFNSFNKNTAESCNSACWIEYQYVQSSLPRDAQNRPLDCDLPVDKITWKPPIVECACTVGGAWRNSTGAIVSSKTYSGIRWIRDIPEKFWGLYG